MAAKLQLVMRNYGDQGRYTNQGRQLDATPIERRQSLSTARHRRAKIDTTPKPVAKHAPRVKRTDVEAQHEKPAPVVRRNSVEFIEGNKRRDVEIP